MPALLAELDRIGADDWKNHPPIIGFLAGLLVHEPARSDFLLNTPSARLSADMAIALSLAGHRDRGLAFAKQSRLDKSTIAFIRSTPPLTVLAIRNATELDFLWGAAFATGDPRYVRAIVRRFVQLANQPGVADDILAASEFMRSKQGDLRGLKERHGRAALLDIALASAILAGLTRNVPEHSFIRQAVTGTLPKGSHAERIFTAFAGKSL